MIVEIVDKEGKMLAKGVTSHDSISTDELKVWVESVIQLRANIKVEDFPGDEVP